MSPRTLSLTAGGLVLLWFLYIAVGWAVAPETCQAASFHIASGVLVVGAITVLVLMGTSVRSRTDEPQSVSRFIQLLWLRLAALFIAGMTLAWVLAAVWC